MKRSVDFVVALILLLVFSPVMLVVAILIRCTLGSPVLFSQPRSGQNGVPFILHKFRTMSDSVDVNGEQLPDSERLTPLGLFLRNSSLDELPGLWQVVTGRMSLVGPRPLLLEYLELYSEKHRRRLEVPPGITGWAQVNGRNALSWHERFDLDVWYIDNASRRLDLCIVWLTVKHVAMRKDINAAGSASMPKYTGQRNVTEND